MPYRVYSCIKGNIVLFLVVHFIKIWQVIWQFSTHLFALKIEHECTKLSRLLDMYSDNKIDLITYRRVHISEEYIDNRNH